MHIRCLLVLDAVLQSAHNGASGLTTLSQVGVDKQPSATHTVARPYSYPYWLTCRQAVVGSTWGSKLGFGVVEVIIRVHLQW